MSSFEKRFRRKPNKKMKINDYFKKIEADVNICYDIANAARAKGLDPMSKVEIPLARSLAERVVGLMSVVYPQINDPKIVKRILDLEKEYGQLDPTVSFKIAEEIAHEKFCKFENQLQAIEAGIRLGFAYNTLGVVSSPIEGFTELRLGKTKEGKDYFKAFFAGPIRSAGTTASCLVLMLIDYLREIFGYAKYDPSEEEIKRYVTENYDYHERVTNLQYLPSEEEIAFLAKNMPIQIDGDPTEKREVSNQKDLERVETNFIRGGMCLCFSEGLAQKGQKGLRLYNAAKSNGVKASGWDFLQEFVDKFKMAKKKDKSDGEKKVPVYIRDLVAGRPVFGHPSRSGAFRFRYGRSRVSGFSAVSVHPATMGISGGFLSNGTQLKVEKPTKGCAITSCDQVDGPIVKLYNGDVRKINDFNEAKKVYNDVEEIIYFGDILFPLGDVINRNYDILKSGYVEEWWWLELKKVLDGKLGEYSDLDKFNVDFDTAFRISQKYDLPLYPIYIFYWNQIKNEDFLELLYYLSNGILSEGKIVLPYSESQKEKFGNAKRALEILGVEHSVSLENIIIKEIEAKALFCNLGLDLDLFKKSKYRADNEINEIIKKVQLKIKENLGVEGKELGVLDLVNLLSKFKIKDRAGTFIGSRMGRPEKAKLRKLVGSPSVLFPIGEEGGRFRSVNTAEEVGTVKSDFPIYKCKKCDKETIYNSCEDCGQATVALHYCRECHQKFEEKVCPEHKIGQKYCNQRIDMRHYYKKALSAIGLDRREAPALIKGVKGTSNEDHTPENLGKGILRAKHRLCVNKDGTIRYDGTETPITHFKSKEIGTSVEKLRELGYDKDVYGKELNDGNQVLELKPHDILIPACPDTLDERGDDVFMRIANFLDDLLVNFYKLKPFYNVKKREDLVGHLVACMAPHNCAGVITRIIGFNKTQSFFASPYVHAAMRRDCDGDEAAMMFLVDTLINFSRKFLPSHRGGTQDAPLVLNARIRAGEVDDQILDHEVVWEYPLELYELGEEGGHHSSELKIEMVKQILAEGKEAFEGCGFTHDTDDFNDCITNSSYKTIPNMQEKVNAQMELVEKLRAADDADVARLVIDRHFIRDLRGNLRKFSQQQFRCVACNTKFRRPPLIGKCTKCNGKVIFTISHGSIIKYLEPAINLANKYDVPAYTKESLILAKKYIESIFGKEKEKQQTMEQWFGGK
jgi:DNA polymerase II large subunit